MHARQPEIGEAVKLITEFRRILKKGDEQNYENWREGGLAGSTAAGMTGTFLAAPLVLIVVPWKYVFKNSVYQRKKK